MAEELAKRSHKAHGIAAWDFLAAQIAGGTIGNKLLTQHLKTCCQPPTWNWPLRFCMPNKHQLLKRPCAFRTYCMTYAALRRSATACDGLDLVQKTSGWLRTQGNMKASAAVIPDAHIQSIAINQNFSPGETNTRKHVPNAMCRWYALICQALPDQSTKRGCTWLMIIHQAVLLTRVAFTSREPAVQKAEVSPPSSSSPFRPART